MLKNVFLSVVFHLISAIIGSYIIFFVDKPDVANLMLFILAIVFYVLFGFIVLKDTGSMKKNCISVLPAFILGLLLLYICIQGTMYNTPPSPWGSRWNWVLYIGYLSPFYWLYSRIFFFLGRFFGNNSLKGDIISGVLSVIPSFLFAVGIMMKKRWRKKKHQKTF